MPAILADVNDKGHVDLLVDLLLTGTLRDLWLELGVRIETFDSLGLANNASDLQIWQVCQQRHVVLITANRNSRGASSLEETIRTLNNPDSLPVITLANERRIIRDRGYAQRAAEQMLNYLLELDQYRGVGRLYVP